ncbi:ATP-dependent endonuclease [Actinoplanes sp. NEAU-A12]|uniref:ATP-dependent endonuclease n=1 Tax=Actinoplanes sandaracinus TaxID=3045177 RepID=A0ABT6X0Y5_9ACTN|nr:TOPRIM nucleotidyl transferase/hydrolase domain-containing protein [Actinoplanes sandaracinus]MDI6105676.1 ATP-dependent endonuclease [Actinoplanes sandaracinus]
MDDRIDGHVRGPGATDLATARALEKIGDARAVLLVEGITDQIALETTAALRGRDLEADRVVIMPIGGAHAIDRVLTALGGRTRLAGLCDLREEELFRRGVTAHIGPAHTRAELEDLGFHVCVDDLEDELIRAVGVEEVEEVFAVQGDLRLFHLFQSQPAWRGRPHEAQIYRFLRSSSRRNLRYIRLLVEAAAARGTLPRPLDALITAV